MMFSVFVVLGLAGFVDMAVVCDNGWMTFNNSCYYFPYDKVQFNGAVVKCTNLGSKLLELSGGIEEQWVILQNVIRGIYTSVWIGLTDLLVENKYVYVSTGEIPSYVNWAAGQPDRNNTEHCAALSIGQMQWHDFSCARKMNYICMKPANDYA